MDCDKYLELMSAALDGELTAEERRALDSHLAVCPECAALFRTLSENTKAMRELDCEVPADLKGRIMSSLPRQETPARQGKVIPWKRWVPVAAAACLVLVVSLLPMDKFLPSGGNSAPMSSAESAGVDGSVRTDAAYGEVANSTAEAPQQPTSADNSGMSSEYVVVGTPESADPGEAVSCSFENQRQIRVGYSDDLVAEARIVGSTESLAAYLSQFGTDSWTEQGTPVPNAELETLKELCTEEFFQTRRLLCVVVVSGSGSNRYELAPQGLYRDSVTILATIPEVGTCDMAAWLLVAEVDTLFDDGDTLEIEFVR